MVKNKEGKEVKRYRCMNFGACAKADSQEIIEIDALETISGKPLCPCCKQDTLEEIPEKKAPTKLIAIIIAAVVVIGGGIGAAIGFSGGENKVETQTVKQETKVQNVAKKDKPDATTNKKTVAIEKQQPEKVEEPAQPKKEQTTTTTKENPKSTTPTKPQNPTYGKVNLGYGVYTGELKNGKPHGHGTIRYTSSHKIVSSKEFVASPGDTFEGEFRDGKISSIGLWHHDGETTGVNP